MGQAMISCDSGFSSHREPGTSHIQGPTEPLSWQGPLDCDFPPQPTADHIDKQQRACYAP